MHTLWKSSCKKYLSQSCIDFYEYERKKTPIREKNIWWSENQEVHSALIEGPFVNGDRFSVKFKYDVTNKKNGKRMNMAEIGMYTVRNDKIVKEEFFYSPE